MRTFQLEVGRSHYFKIGSDERICRAEPSANVSIAHNNPMGARVKALLRGETIITIEDKDEDIYQVRIEII